MARPGRRDVLHLRLRPRREAVGRRGAVEVPRGRLVVPWAEPDVGAIATQAFANPRYGPGRAGAPPPGPLRGRGRGAAHGGRRRRDAAAARHRRRHRAALRRSRARAATTGPAAAPARDTPRRETSSSRRRPSTRSPRRSRRAPDGRSPSGFSTASTPRRRPAATAAASSPRRSSSSSRSGLCGAFGHLVDLRVDDHGRPIEELRRLYAIHQALFGTDATGRVAAVDDGASHGDRRATRAARLRHVSGTGPGVENLEERVDGEDAIDPVVLEALRRLELSVLTGREPRPARPASQLRRSRTAVISA